MTNKIKNTDYLNKTQLSNDSKKFVDEIFKQDKNVIWVFVILYDYVKGNAFTIYSGHKNKKRRSNRNNNAQNNLFKKAKDILENLSKYGDIIMLTNKFLEADVIDRKIIISRFDRQKTPQDYKNLVPSPLILELSYVNPRINRFKSEHRKTIKEWSKDDGKTNNKPVMDLIRQFNFKPTYFYNSEEESFKQITKFAKIKMTEGIKEKILQYFLCVRLLSQTKIKWQYHLWAPTKSGQNPPFAMVIGSKKHISAGYLNEIIEWITQQSLAASVGMIRRETLIARESSLRSAIAAIMSRNVSHIHGSHIEHGLRNKMDFFDTLLNDKIYSNEPLYEALKGSLQL